MKKYMIAAATLLLFAGVTNAQEAQKKPSKATTVKQTAVTKPGSVSNKSTNATASVSPTAKKSNISECGDKKKTSP